MARTKSQIKAEMTMSFMANSTLSSIYGFTPGTSFEAEFSLVSLENIIFEIVALMVELHEKMFDQNVVEVLEIIETKMPHRASWYRTKALSFQYGFDLITDTDKYDNNGFTDEQIEASKIIKYSAVTQNGGQLLIKIASESNDLLAPITPPQKQAFDAYVREIADCGVKYIVINNPADILLLNMKVFCDPLVLDSTGMSILYGNYPVQEAILQYMKELPFNGELVLFDLETKIKAVDGVKIPDIFNAQSQIYDIGSGTYQPAQPITVKIVPDSGYFKILNFDNITYVV
ncbi:hypothetical protein CFS9_13070 [Flavobacterium sp. CFS9]|uniref:Uncharacterized protein n=1 Tax=Flavobacterium sp. CFS9 TaxID=3143118 RepID=A0AAT9GZI3_9FLAO